MDTSRPVLSIPAQLRLLSLVLLIGGLLSGFSVYFLVGRSQLDGRVVNFAGIVRGGTQRLSKQALAGTPAPALADRIQRIIRGLREGDTELNLPTAKDREFIARIERVEAEFTKLRALAFGPLNDATRTSLFQASEAFFETTNLAVSRAEEIAGEHVSETRRIVAVTATISGLLALVVGIWLTRRVSQPLRQMARSLDEQADDVQTSAQSLANASQSIAEGSSRQAAALEETSASLEELRSMIRISAERAQTAAQLAGNTRAAADSGGSALSELNACMRDVQASSQSVSKIIATIDEIAFQTNILALNAAVEAARAGESGAGFAVVADEVRNLARRSAEAAKQTAAIVENSVGQNNRSQELTTAVSSRFEEILGQVRELHAFVGEISKALDEENTGIGQIATAITDIDRVVQSNASAAQEGASVAAVLRQRAVELEANVLSLSALVGVHFSHSLHSAPATPPPSPAAPAEPTPAVDPTPSPPPTT